MANKNKAQVSREQVACYSLRLTGMTVRAIATALADQDPPINITASTVQRRLNDEIAEQVTPLTAAVRQIEIDRLDYYLSRLEPAILVGSDKAINAALRVGERRAKLMGLDAPVQVNAAIEITEAEKGLATLLDAARAREATKEADLRGTA